MDRPGQNINGVFMILLINLRMNLRFKLKKGLNSPFIEIVKELLSG